MLAEVTGKKKHWHCGTTIKYNNSYTFNDKEMDMLKKKVALCDIAKIKKSQIFVLFENEALYEDCFCLHVF